MARPDVAKDGRPFIANASQEWPRSCFGWKAVQMHVLLQTWRGFIIALYRDEALALWSVLVVRAALSCFV